MSFNPSFFFSGKKARLVGIVGISESHSSNFSKFPLQFQESPAKKSIKTEWIIRQTLIILERNENFFIWADWINKVNPHTDPLRKKFLTLSSRYLYLFESNIKKSFKNSKWEIMKMVSPFLFRGGREGGGGDEEGLG